MENSPLRFLDYDVSQKVKKELKLVKENYARDFHIKNFKKCNNFNKDNLYRISKVYNFMYIYTSYELQKCSVKVKIMRYEQEYKYLENTRLEMCGYIL